jgi:hypothetical protein
MICKGVVVQIREKIGTENRLIQPSKNHSVFQLECCGISRQKKREAMQNKKVVPGIELESPESESDVLTITPYNLGNTGILGLSKI